MDRIGGSQYDRAQFQGTDNAPMFMNRREETFQLQQMPSPPPTASTNHSHYQNNNNVWQRHPQSPPQYNQQPASAGATVNSNSKNYRHGGSFQPQIKSPKLQKRHAGAPTAPVSTDNLLDRTAYQSQSFHGLGYEAGGSQIGAPQQLNSRDRSLANQFVIEASNGSQNHGQLTQSQSQSPGNFGQHGVRTSTSQANDEYVQDVEGRTVNDSLGRNFQGRTRQKNHKNYFHWKVKFGNSILEPGVVSIGLTHSWFKDILQREEYVFHEANSFLDPQDGRLTPLVVQAVDMVFDGPDNSNWRRTFVRNISPLSTRVSNWTIDLLSDTRAWTKRDWTAFVGKWTLSCFALIFIVPFSGTGPGSARNGGCYDPIPYKDWNYYRNPRNIKEINPTENDQSVSQNNRLSLLEIHEHSPKHELENQSNSDIRTVSNEDLFQHFHPESNRTLRPRYLCLLNNYRESSTLEGFEVISVEQWMRTNGATSHPEYLFVAYAAQQFDCGDAKDHKALINLAERASRDAGLEAFWLACVCLRDADESGIIEDVWRMSDIVRGANAMSIVVGHSVGQRGKSDVVHIRDMLLGWGKRMWTLPEALLSPKGSPVRVYIRGMSQYQSFEKRSLAVQIWKDAAVSRQLMDHFEGLVILSPLELVVIALRCLNNRDTNICDFDSRIKGEMAYVLMGLLRRRPIVNMDDSAFQAFARLSLANDSNLLLERLVCVMPTYSNQRWHDTSDHWGAQLWDIYPSCQIAGIGTGDTIVLDGAVGASIKWDRFERVAYSSKDSIRRTISRFVLRFSPILFVIGLVLAYIYRSGGSTLGIAVILIIFSVAVLGASPYLVRLLSTGKLWDTQALFFGFEGYMDIATIETHIFGAYTNRLSWSPFGSPLSRHSPGKNGDCVGLDPTSDPRTSKKVEESYKSSASDNRVVQKRIFTLIDTFTMTVTMFEAKHPPVAVLVCGSEGGMQRAALCSYDSDSHAFCREGVLRMETRVLGRMSRVARLRFCFRRPMASTKES